MWGIQLWHQLLNYSIDKELYLSHKAADDMSDVPDPGHSSIQIKGTPPTPLRTPLRSNKSFDALKKNASFASESESERKDNMDGDGDVNMTSNETAVASGTSIPTKENEDGDGDVEMTSNETSTANKTSTVSSKSSKENAAVSLGKEHSKISKEEQKARAARESKITQKAVVNKKNWTRGKEEGMDATDGEGGAAWVNKLVKFPSGKGDVHFWWRPGETWRGQFCNDQVWIGGDKSRIAPRIFAWYSKACGM